MKLALIGSPRTGNNWVRRLIADALEVPQVGAHAFADFSTPLPLGCVLQIHTYRSAEALAWLRAHDVSVIALARHPLDVLVSVLQFARLVPEVHLWLDGDCQIPADTTNLAPEDPEAVGFMKGGGAKKLLSVSLQWWGDPDVVDRLRYEDVVADPKGRLSLTFERIGATATSDLDQALAKYSVSYFAQFRNHGWIGEAGSYRRFLTAQTCEELRHIHSDYFETMGYDIDPDVQLTVETAASNYRASLPPAVA